MALYRGDNNLTVGKTGKSAYEYAVEGGFTGTEEEFAEKLGQHNVVITEEEYETFFWGKF